MAHILRKSMERVKKRLQDVDQQSGTSTDSEESFYWDGMFDHVEYQVS